MTKAPRPVSPIRFDTAASSLLQAVWRPEFSVEEIPAPQRIAPYSVAIAADVASRGLDLGTGRLILLHDPQGNPAWDGEFRCVSFVKAAVEPDLATDPFLTGVGWSWLTSALEEHQAAHCAAAGTVTFVTSQSFGSMDAEPATSEIEIRASWTPLLAPDGSGLADHVDAWQGLLCLACGLPPIPAGIATIAHGRRR